MFKLVKCENGISDGIAQMLEELGEPPQVLTHDSPRPLVVHREMGQMTLVARGAGLAHLAGRTVALAAGDLLILTPGCKHSFAAVGGDLHLRHWHWPQALLNEDRSVLQDDVDFGPVAAAPDLDGNLP
ncbi:MAG: AraC family ligand binding domain-containing protein [Pseudonocardiaceae bacterium]